MILFRDLAESSFFIYIVFSIMILTGIVIMMFLPTSPVEYGTYETKPVLYRF